MADAEIPVLDLAAFEAADSARKDRLGFELDEALKRVGFLTVTGHGVSQNLIDDAYGYGMEFFRMPVEEKLKSSRTDKVGTSRGYVPRNFEQMSTLPDIKESFSMGRLTPPGPTVSAEQRGRYVQNVWPQQPAPLRSAYERYYTEQLRLAGRLLSVFATILGLDDNFFRRYYLEHECLLRGQYYPPVDTPPLPGQLRMAAHVDYAAVTVLCVKNKEGARGLQLLHGDGEWLDMVPQDNVFIVNLGEVMKMWTNERWKSTVHRVVIPEQGMQKTDRLSLTFFAVPDPDSLIECLPTCREDGLPPRFAPVIAGEWRAEMFRRISY